MRGDEGLPVGRSSYRAGKNLLSIACFIFSFFFTDLALGSSIDKHLNRLVTS